MSIGNNCSEILHEAAMSLYLYDSEGAKQTVKDKMYEAQQEISLAQDIIHYHLWLRGLPEADRAEMVKDSDFDLTKLSLALNALKGVQDGFWVLLDSANTRKG